jgi:type IV/VI secretion system ImpK/VasF family protein
MEKDQLRAIRPIFGRMTALASGGPGSAAPPPVPGADDSPTRVSTNLTVLHGELRDLLVELRAQLSRDLSERDCYLALFPIVVHLDEIIQTKFASALQSGWPLLQRDFFDTDRGGELFYDTLDELLERDRPPQLVYEIYFFCLNLGFQGKNAGDDKRRATYMRRLSHFFVVPETPEQTPRSDSGNIKPPGTYVWYYLGAGGVVVLLYLIFWALSSARSGPLS